MKQLFILLLACIFAASCNNQPTAGKAIPETTKAVEPSDTTTRPTSLPGYEIFKNFPDTIDGCSGVFALSEKAFKAQQFIFISNLEGLGMLQVDGKIVYLHLSKRTEGTEGTYTDEYAGEGFTLKIKITKVGLTGDELNSNEGTLEIRSGNEKKAVTIFGETGC